MSKKSMVTEPSRTRLRAGALPKFCHTIFGTTVHGSGSRHLEPLRGEPDSLFRMLTFDLGLDGPLVRELHAAFLARPGGYVRDPAAHLKVLQAVVHGIGKARAETRTHGRRCVVGFHKHCAFYNARPDLPGHRVVGAVLRFLEDAGLITIMVSPGQGRTSYFEPTAAFPMDARLVPVVLDARGNVVVKRTKANGAGARTGGQADSAHGTMAPAERSTDKYVRDSQLSAEPLATVERVRAEIARINAHSLRYSYFLCDTDDQWYQLSHGAVILRVVFNNGGVSDGGRNFSLFHSLPQREIHVRETLRIGTGETVELDFANFHIRMLYHRRGLEFDGDCYEAIDTPDWDATPETKRALLKQIVLALPNCGKVGKSAKQNRESAYKMARRLMVEFRNRPNQPEWPGRLPDGGDETAHQAAVDEWRRHSLPDDITAEYIVDRILEAHAPIADDLYTGVGVLLQGLDGQLARNVLLRFVDLGRPCLSCHDSFYVWPEDEQLLHQAMVDEYRALPQFHGFTPVVTRKKKHRAELSPFPDEFRP